MNFIEENSKIWDKRSKNNDIWSIAVSEEEVKRAKDGIWNIVLTPSKPVPRSWFPEQLEGKKLLCLAGGGGQQYPGKHGGRRPDQLKHRYQQRLQGQLCDVSIRVQGREFRAHRAVLAASSPYFHDQVLLKGMTSISLPSVTEP